MSFTFAKDLAYNSETFDSTSVLRLNEQKKLLQNIGKNR